MRSAACHPSLARRTRRPRDSSLCPEPSSRAHAPCLVGIPACSMCFMHQHTNPMETSCIATYLPTLFGPSVVTNHQTSTQKNRHQIRFQYFYLYGCFLKEIPKPFMYRYIFSIACCILKKTWREWRDGLSSSSHQRDSDGPSRDSTDLSHSDVQNETQHM